MDVLVDSSVWIAASNPKNKEKNQLTRLIQENAQIFVIKLIQVEVTQGARTIELFQKLWDSFLGFEFLSVDDKHWNHAALNFFKCRKKGITLSTTDCLIATVASDYGIPLWSVDSDFKRMRSVVGFEIFSATIS